MASAKVRILQGNHSLVASDTVRSGETILEEESLVAFPLPDSLEHALLCDACMAPCAPLAQQLEHAADLPSGAVQLPFMEDEDGCECTPCRRGCDAQFCSPACEGAAWDLHHRVLCPAVSGGAQEAVEAFEEHAHETDELFLFGARLVAMVHSALHATSAGRGACHALTPQGCPCAGCGTVPPACRCAMEASRCKRCVASALEKSGLAPFCTALYWDLPSAPEARAECRAQCERSLALLHRAIHACQGGVAAGQGEKQAVGQAGHAALPTPSVLWPSMDDWGHLLGLLRQNALCVEVASPLAGLLPGLREWCVARGAKTGGVRSSKRKRGLAKGAPPHPEASQAASLSRVLDALPPEAWESVQGSAVFPLAACANHSCDPTAEVRFERGNATLRLVARQTIRAGDEITISYIDQNETAGVAERREALRDYGFVCECAACAPASGGSAGPQGGHARLKRAFSVDRLEGGTEGAGVLE